MQVSLAAGLQEAVSRTLSVGTKLPGLCGVMDKPPARYPHIVFGRTGICDGRTGIENDNEQLFTLHVWSTARTDEEALAIMRHAKALLDGRRIKLGDGSTATVRLEFAEARHDEDLELRHGLLRFRATSVLPARRGGRRQGAAAGH